MLPDRPNSTKLASYTFEKALRYIQYGPKLERFGQKLWSKASDL